MKTALWIYFAGVAILCLSLSIAISWFEKMLIVAHRADHLPLLTHLLIHGRLWLYAVPLPSFFIALWFTIKGGLDAQRTHLIGAYSFLVLVLLICFTMLAAMLPFLPPVDFIR